MHQLIDLGSCVSLRGRSDHGLVREHKLDLLSNMELNPMHVLVLFNQLAPMGPLFHALLPSSGRSGSFAFVGRRQVSLC